MKAAGGVLTAKQAPHRPGTAPTLGLRAGCVVAPIVEQTTIAKKRFKGVPMSLVEVEVPRQSAEADAAAPGNRVHVSLLTPGTVLVLLVFCLGGAVLLQWQG